MVHFEPSSQLLLKSNMLPTLSGGLLKHRSLGLLPGVSDSVYLGWSPRIYISNKFPDSVDMSGSKFKLLYLQHKFGVEFLAANGSSLVNLWNDGF